MQMINEGLIGSIRNLLDQRTPFEGSDLLEQFRGDLTMDVRAAVAFEAGKPLAVTVQLEGPKAAPAGVEIKTRPFQLVTGRVWEGTAFSGARGRTDVPKIVDWYMDGKIQIDPMITHVMPLMDINRAFDLMHSGESIRSVVIY
jgi:Zn-dependent alcohol dehydrogenase